MNKKHNAIVGQSGGPTSAINATLAGVIYGAAESGAVKRLYGMRNGIEGLLKRNIKDLSYLFDNEKELSLLSTTPSCALGSCRKKLSGDFWDSEYTEIFEILNELDVKYFFYIGGNDSMDTLDKLCKSARARKEDIRFVGIPKTVDNDIAITDHTPGYGSAAKYIATAVKEIAQDCSVYTQRAVTLIESMGRDAGWLTAASALASYTDGAGPDLIYLPEVDFCFNKFLKSVKDLLEQKPNIVAVVSEGARFHDGAYVGSGAQSGALDEFGHKYLSGAGKVLESLIREKISCKVRSIELSLPQRCAGHILSATDIKESLAVGKDAVRYALQGQSGKMVAFERGEHSYSISTHLVDLSDVANKVKILPRDYINSEGNYVTPKCIEYMLPLIQGEVDIRYKDGLPVHFKLR